MDFEKLKKQRVEGNAFIKLIGLELTEVREGYCKGVLELDPEKHNSPIGTTHGGVIFSICDTISGTAATTHGTVVTTISGTINYLNAARNCKKLIAEAKEVKYGKQTSVYQVDVTNENGQAIAVTTFTFFHLRSMPFPEL